MTKKLFNVSASDLQKSGTLISGRSKQDVAVIGMAVDLPQSGSLEDYWTMISQGLDYVGNIPAYRKAQMELLQSNLGDSQLKDYHFDVAAYLDDIDGFDHAFFNIPYDDAVVINPMHRKLLQTSFHCLENAGYTRQKIAGTRTGVYLGYSWNLNSYFSIIKNQSPELYQYAITQNIASTLAGRLSYYYDLHGPSIVLDTACSSSLVGVHQACESIANGKTDMAMVCGANLTFGLNQANTNGLGIESSSNRSLSYDEEADGIGKGEGIVTVLLKSLTQAIRDNDPIQAVIKGSATNNDGGRSVGAAAPSVKAQSDVLVSAWSAAGINPADIGYIEGHGTGTKLGDPIEVQALTNAFCTYTNHKQFCALGSVKANIGHLDTAAGISGFVKSVLCLKHQQLPPQPNFQKPNQKIAFLESPVFVNTQLKKWEVGHDKNRLAGVSAFGISGTNCHVLLQEYLPDDAALQRKPKDESQYLFTLSAKSVKSLTMLIMAYIQHYQHGSQPDIGELCTSVARYRTHFRYRIAIITDNLKDLEIKLKTLSQKPLDEFEAPWYFSAVSRDNRQDYNNSHLLHVIHRTPATAEQEARKYLESEAPKFVDEFDRGYRLNLPNYPFDEVSCWVKLETPPTQPDEAPQETKQDDLNNPNTTNNPMPDQDNLTDRLKNMVAETLNANANTIQADKTFFELGFDSINLIHIKRKLQKEFNLDIPVEDLFSDLNTISKLSVIPALQQTTNPNGSQQENGKSVEGSKPVFEKTTEVLQTTNTATGLNDMNTLFSRQLSLMEEQISLLKAAQSESARQKTSSKTKNAIRTSSAAATTMARPASHAYTDSGRSYTDNQRIFLGNLIERLSQRTQKSKVKTQMYRQPFSSYRKAMYYDHFFKELVYPVFAAKASGSHFTDIDGNEYLDFAMGFGVHLLGYNPPEVVKAINAQIEDGIFIGPMSPLAGEVAKMISDITGLERVAYANSGTEAVMHAIRIARAKTSRSLVIKFNNAYHGFYDVIQAMPDPEDELHSISGSRGVPQSMVEDVLVLDYGSEQSLEIIREHLSEAACVLVEPIQSRRPEFQPAAFLKALRKLTANADVPLIFDEIITGFRVHQRGAMGYYGIEADIVTYGKVVGGTMPMGIVAGKSAYLDYMDGGYWQYGDDSGPSDLRVGTGGTFCHHPVALAAAKATLGVIQKEGNALYDDLNTKTAMLRDRLNEYFSTHEIPVKIVNCGSLFSFKPQRDLRVMQVLYYLLQERGIYLWQGATSFISRAHTEEDIERLITTVDECCQVLMAQGFVKPGNTMKVTPIAPAEHYEVSPSQRRLWFMHQLYPKLNAYNQVAAYRVHSVQLATLVSAVEIVIIRHESLRTRFQSVNDRPRQVIDDFDQAKHGLIVRDKAGWDEGRIPDEMKEEMQAVFDLEKGPLFKLIAYKTKEESYLFINLHHLIADGLSIEIVLKEIMISYQALLNENEPELKPLAFQYKDYSSWINEQLRAPGISAHKAYWAQKLRNSDQRVIILPDHEPGDTPDFEGEMIPISLKESQTESLKALARKQDITLFVLILAIIKVLINKQGGDGKVSVGCPYSGRFSEEFYNQVGFYVNTLVLADEVNSTDSFSQVLEKVKLSVAEAARHQIYPYDQLVQDLSEDRKLSRNQLFDIDVNMNEQDFGNYGSILAEEASLEAIDLKPGTTKFDMTFSIYQGNTITIALEYRTALYEKATIVQMKHRLLNIISSVTTESLAVPISQINYENGMANSHTSVFEKKELF